MSAIIVSLSVLELIWPARAQTRSFLGYNSDAEPGDEASAQLIAAEGNIGEGDEKLSANVIPCNLLHYTSVLIQLPGILYNI